MQSKGINKKRVKRSNAMHLVLWKKYFDETDIDLVEVQSEYAVRMCDYHQEIMERQSKLKRILSSSEKRQIFVELGLVDLLAQEKERENSRKKKKKKR